MLAITLLHLAWTRRGSSLLLLFSLLPSLSVVPLSRFWSPQYLYVPLAFGALLLAEFVTAVPRLRQALYVVLPVLGLVSFVDAFRFRSDSCFRVKWRFIPGVVRRTFTSVRLLARSAVFRLRESTISVRSRRTRGCSRTSIARRRFPISASPSSSLVTPRPRATCFFRRWTSNGTGPDARRLRHNAALAALLGGDASAAARELEVEVQRADALPESVAIYRVALAELGR